MFWDTSNDQIAVIVLVPVVAAFELLRCCAVFVNCILCVVFVLLVTLVLPVLAGDVLVLVSPIVQDVVLILNVGTKTALKHGMPFTVSHHVRCSSQLRNFDAL